MFKQRSICAAALIAAMIAFSAGAASAVHHHRPTHRQATLLRVWKPNSQLVEQLDTEVPVLGSYAVRPPQGYTLTTAEMPIQGIKLHAYIWRGAPRPEGGYASFTLIGARLTPSQLRRVPLDSIMNGFLVGIRRYYQSWVRTLNQRGVINGIVFERTFQKGPAAAAPNVTIHSFGYGAITGTTVVVMGSADREPDSEDSLDLAEAAAMTFHKRS